MFLCGRTYYRMMRRGRRSTSSPTNVAQIVSCRPSLLYSILHFTYKHLDRRGAGVRFPAEARDFSLLHDVQTGPGAHLTSYTMGKEAEA
jgi:hypothetical protein